MRTTLAIAIVLAPALALADAASEVRATLEGYRKALLDGNGAQAARLVDKETLDYYAKMRELALTAPAATVKQQPLLDRLMIVFLRHRMTPKSLRAMSPEKLFVHAVGEGWISKSSVANLALGEVTVEGERAVGALVYQGKPVPLQFRFRRERGKWRLSLRSVMEVGERALAQMARQQSLDEDAFVVRMAEAASKTPVRRDIWDPPKL